MHAAAGVLAARRRLATRSVKPTVVYNSSRTHLVRRFAGSGRRLRHTARVLSLQIIGMVASADVSLPCVGLDAKPVEFATAPKDKKLYRRISLGNGLLAVLISDPEMANQVSGGSESEADMSDDDASEEDDDEVYLWQAGVITAVYAFSCLGRAV